MKENGLGRLDAREDDVVLVVLDLQSVVRVEEGLVHVREHAFLLELPHEPAHCNTDTRTHTC